MTVSGRFPPLVLRYLEKIIQLQVPVPAIFESEITRVFRANLERGRRDFRLPDNYGDDTRFQELNGVLFEGIIRTPRDLKRLLGVFAVLRQMSLEEVNWLDVIGYSALLCKAPDVAELVHRDPLFFTYEFQNTLRWLRERNLPDRDDHSAQDAAYLGDGWEHEPYAPLLTFLFGRLRGGTSRGIPDHRHRDDQIDQISRYRPLSILLRQGMPPDTWSIDEVRGLLDEVADGRVDALERAISSERADDLVLVMETRVDRLQDQDLVRFWVQVGEWLKKPDCSIPTELDPMWFSVHRLPETFEAMLQDAQPPQERFYEIITQLTNAEAFEFASQLLRDQAHAYGLFGLTQNDRRIRVSSSSEIENLCRNASIVLLERHLSSDWFFSSWGLAPVNMLNNFSLWDDTARERLHEITENRSAFRAFTMMIFSSNHAIDRAGLDPIFAADLFVERLEREIASNDLAQQSSDIQYSIQRAADHFGIRRE